MIICKNEQAFSNPQISTFSNYFSMKKIITFCAIFITTLTQAQNIEFEKDNFKDNKEGYKDAVKSIKHGDEICLQGPSFFKDAIPYYLAADKLNSSNASLNFKIGKSYLYSKYKLKSIPYLEKAYSLNPSIDPQIHYFLGQAYHLNMQWDKAIDEFNTFIKTAKPIDRQDLFPEPEKQDWYPKIF